LKKNEIGDERLNFEIAAVTTASFALWHGNSSKILANSGASPLMNQTA
jgi:hypothetical protein